MKLIGCALIGNLIEKESMMKWTPLKINYYNEDLPDYSVDRGLSSCGFLHLHPLDSRASREWSCACTVEPFT